MKTHYDVVVIGSGLGGLVSAIIMAKEGFSVCVLEKTTSLEVIFKRLLETKLFSIPGFIT